MKGVLIALAIVLSSCADVQAGQKKVFEHSHDEPLLSPMNIEEMGSIGLMNTDDAADANCNFWREGADTSSAAENKKIYVLTTLTENFGISAQMNLGGIQQAVKVQSVKKVDAYTQVWKMTTIGDAPIKLIAHVTQVSEMLEGDGFQGEIKIIEPKDAGLVRFGGWCDHG